MQRISKYRFRMMLLPGRLLTQLQIILTGTITCLYKAVADMSGYTISHRGTAYGYSLWEFEVYGKSSSINTLCPAGNTTFRADLLTGPSYQWQVDDGSGYTDITDGGNYSGANTTSLNLSNAPSSFYGYKYRCSVNGIKCNPVTLTFTSTWTGTANTSWENPKNWTCGQVPDANTDVIVNAGTVIVKSNRAVRSLHLGTGVTFTVNSEF